MSVQNDIQKFLEQQTFAVAGASVKQDKYGNKVLRCYMQHGKRVFPVHPLEKKIETLTCYKSLAEIPEKIGAISLVTPPSVTEKIVEEAHQLGIKYVWLQPGAESPKAIDFCQQNGMTVIADGPCLLVVLGYKDSWQAGDTLLS